MMKARLLVVGCLAGALVVGIHATTSVLLAQVGNPPGAYPPGFSSDGHTSELFTLKPETVPGGAIQKSYHGPALVPFLIQKMNDPLLKGTPYEDKQARRYTDLNFTAVKTLVGGVLTSKVFMSINVVSSMKPISPNDGLQHSKTVK